MPQTEDVFRADLLKLARACDWPAWDTCRLIFADWLEERGCVEAAFACADWRCVWIKKDRPQVSQKVRLPWVYLLEAPVARLPVKGTGGIGRHNAETLLCFQPGSLKLLRYVWRDPRSAPTVFPPAAVQFSWCPMRTLVKHPWTRQRTDRDGKLWPHGFADLWLDVAPSKSLFS